MFVFSLLIGGFTVVCATEILVQALAPVHTVNPPECRSTLAALDAALLRARASVEMGGATERATVEAFRRALMPEWSQEAAAREACKADHPAAEALEALVQLRYAEESSVRAQTSDLLPLRARVGGALRRLSALPTGD